jgi:hypothetical protein
LACVVRVLGGRIGAAAGEEQNDRKGTKKMTIPHVYLSFPVAGAILLVPAQSCLRAARYAKFSFTRRKTHTIADAERIAVEGNIYLHATRCRPFAKLRRE